MATLFGSLEIGRKSLNASQLALEVAGNNIANINTPGYSRQRAVLQPSLPLATGAGLIGTGVDVTSIQGVRDRFIEARLSGVLQSHARQEEIVGYLSQVESVFDIHASGLQDSIANFFNSFSSLSQNPESVPYRGNVILAAQNLVSQFQASSQQLTTIQRNLDQAVTSAVHEINRLAAGIASLNQQIFSLELGGAEANSLRDERQELLNELSEWVDIRYYEDESGSVSVSVAAGTIPLVSSVISQPLNTNTVDPASQLVQVRSATAVLDTRIEGGKLAGFLEVRDRLIPRYLAQLDELASAVITEVNALHTSGLDLDLNAGINFFDPDPAPVSGAAARIALNPAIASNPRLIAAAGGSAAGTGNNETALKLAGLASARVLGGVPPTQTLADALGALQFGIGNDQQDAKQRLNTQSSLLTQLRNQRDSISGVSLDEEAIDLVRFQRAFQAASRYISLIDSLTEELMQTLGR
ncbi:MAG: flagellar hook-associated protein FlgK [Acidobacteriota bacterium]